MTTTPPAELHEIKIEKKTVEKKESPKAEQPKDSPKSKATLLESVENKKIEAKPKKDVPKSIEWTVIEDKGASTECKYSAGNVRLTVHYYWQEGNRIWNLSIQYKDTFSMLDREIRGRFRNMKELDSFLLSHYNEFFYAGSEKEIVAILDKYKPRAKEIIR